MKKKKQIKNLIVDGAYSLYQGDCLDVTKLFDDNSFDSCITDPPYNLSSNSRYKPGAAPAQDKHGQYKRMSKGFMGQEWDGTDVAFRPETWREVKRVLKPGAYLAAYGGRRTFHRMCCA